MNCSRCSTFPARCCRRSWPRPDAAPKRRFRAPACRSRVSPAISRRRSSAKRACNRASRRTLTAPAASCFSTRDARRSHRRTISCRPWRGGSAPEVEALAASVADNGGVYLVPAFAGLGAPHWDAYARGSIFGLTRGTTGGHIARAALESIAYQSAELVRAMESDADIRLSELRVDGGATANNLLMQFQADILGVPVIRPKVAETTALGAAYLAGLAVGYWRDPGDIAANWQAERRFEPAMSRDKAASLMADWSKAVERAKRWA